MISRQEALKAALIYLGQQYKGMLKVIDSLPDIYSGIYRAKDLKDSWVLKVPKLSHEPQTVGRGRIICISKETGQIIYDGSDGGE